MTASLSKDPTPSPPDADCCAVYYVDEDRVARVRDAMLPESLARLVAETFKILGHPTRVKIVRALAREELCVCDLANVLGLSISATSHQLRAMRNSRLVDHRVEGKLVYYRLRDTFVAECLEAGVKHLSRGSDDR